MGQAKNRGSQTERAEQAKARIEAIKPQKIVCNSCKEDITDIHVMDSRGMDGIEAAFAGICACGCSTFAMKGDPEAVAAAVDALQESIGHDGILGSQPILKK